MVRRHHHVRRRQRGRERAFLGHADIAGQQQGMPRALHPQHAAIGVGIRRILLGRQRMQERETQAIGFPGLPSRAAQPCDRRHT